MSVGVQSPKLRFWGIDRAIAYTVAGRGWSVLAGPITIILLARFLSPEEQGFYYTFASILGLQIFFELGLSYVVLQFASHEKAQLEWTSSGTLEGDPIAKSRLSSLLRGAIVYYGVVANLIVATVLPAGLFFFGSHQSSGTEVAWRAPWIWIVLVSACALIVSPLFAVLEGCGLVADIALMRTCQAILGNLLVWLALSQHWKLFAIPILSTSGLLWGLGWLVLRKRAFLVDLVSFRHRSAVVGWRGEVWPFQWRIALSWVSGYLVFQLFTPVLFAFHGAAAAGQMGMSVSVVTTIAAMAISWVTTKAAPFGGLIARRDFRTLDRLFFPSLWQSLALAICGWAGFWSVSFFLHHIQHPLSHRLLDPLPLGLLIGAAILYHIIGAEAVYLRAHKEEPFLKLSLLNGGLITLSTYFLGRHFGATGMMVGYFTITLCAGVGLGTRIFVQKRRLWHRE